MTGVLIKEEEIWTQIFTEERWCENREKIAFHQDKGPALRNQPCQYLNLTLSFSGAVRKYIFVYANKSWYFVMTALANSYTLPVYLNFR